MSKNILILMFELIFILFFIHYFRKLPMTCFLTPVCVLMMWCARLSLTHLEDWLGGKRKIREGKKEDAGLPKCQNCFPPFKAVRSFTHLLFHFVSHLHIKSCNLNLVIFNRCATRSAVWAKASMVSSIHHVDTKQPLQTSGKIYSL